MKNEESPSSSTGVKRRSKDFKRIMDKIFYMQCPAGWAIEDYQHLNIDDKTKERWVIRAVLLIKALGSEERALQILNIIQP